MLQDSKMIERIGGENMNRLTVRERKKKKEQKEKTWHTDSQEFNVPAHFQWSQTLEAGC